MARHNEFGKKGEELASGWLSEKGFSILHRNWRQGHEEIDIIALRGGIYHFIEVKCSVGTMYGYPEERVSKSKLRSMMRVASHWLYTNHILANKRVQYDVLAITFNEGPPVFTLFEDISL